MHLALVSNFLEDSVMFLSASWMLLPVRKVSHPVVRTNLTLELCLFLRPMRWRNGSFSLTQVLEVSTFWGRA